MPLTNANRYFSLLLHCHRPNAESTEEAQICLGRSIHCCSELFASFHAFFPSIPNHLTGVEINFVLCSSPKHDAVACSCRQQSIWPIATLFAWSFPAQMTQSRGAVQEVHLWTPFANRVHTHSGHSNHLVDTNFPNDDA